MQKAWRQTLKTLDNGVMSRRLIPASSVFSFISFDFIEEYNGRMFRVMINIFDAPRFPAKLDRKFLCSKRKVQCQPRTITSRSTAFGSLYLVSVDEMSQQDERWICCR